MESEALVIEEVSKSFGEVRAVENLSARLPGGSIYGFLGPNGAGKTTTIRMIMNIIRPDSGRIRLLGENISGSILDRVGYMPEERGLYRKMSVRAVLAYLGSIKGMSRREVTRALERWLGEVGLADWAGNKVEELSRGMQQKLQFVATVINGPELLILDEPFSGLDPINLDLLKNIMLALRDEGRTVIFSTHMMEQAEKLCDYILLINKGEKVIDGRLGDIRSQLKSNTVILDLEDSGGAGYVAGLPMVSGTEKGPGNKIEVSLAENGDPQEVLRAVVERHRIRSFEVKAPSLHEIFIHLVGQAGGGVK
ncbi:MAG: ATP-binding cassette domain-containing protein [Gemmatimonadota bacterium]|nr:ATP-binding cassette domain-containing protein [Gemmatimonadota bacterium]